MFTIKKQTNPNLHHFDYVGVSEFANQTQTLIDKKVLNQNKIYPWTVMFRTQVKIRVCKVAYLFFKNKQTSNQQ